MALDLHTHPKQMKSMKNKITLSVLAFAATLLINGCVKDGPVGPQGPPGYDGNANVIGTNSVTVGWTLSGNAYTSTINVPDISQDIVDKGIVEVYINYANEWWVLPDVIGINSTTYGFGVGYVTLYNSNSDGTKPDYPPSSIFRVVVVSASNRMANPNVDWKNYSEVKEALHLSN